MQTQSTILQDLISGFFTSLEFTGYVENPTKPIEADRVFSSLIDLAPFDSRTYYTKSLISNIQNIAGEIAREGNSTSITVGQDTITDLTFNIVKISKVLHITNEMIDKFSRVEAVLQSKPDVRNIGLFLDKVGCSPKLLVDAINQGIEMITWFGSHVATVLAQNGTATQTDYDKISSVPGVFKNSAISSVVAASSGTGTGSAQTLWINKSAQEIINDLIAISNSIEATCFKKPNILAVSMDMYNYLTQTLVNTAYNADKTLLDTIKKALPHLKIIGCYRMNDLSLKYTDNLGERAIMLIKDIDYSSIVTSTRGILGMSQHFDERFYRMHAYTSGLCVYNPGSIRILTNI